MRRFRQSQITPYGDVDPAVIAQLIETGGAVASTAITVGAQASANRQSRKPKKKRKASKAASKRAAAEIVAAAPTTIANPEPEAYPSWLVPGAAVLGVLGLAGFVYSRNRRESAREERRARVLRRMGGGE